VSGHTRFASAIVIDFRFLEHREDGAAPVLRGNRSPTGIVGPPPPIGDDKEGSRRRAASAKSYPETSRPIASGIVDHEILPSALARDRPPVKVHEVQHLAVR
jgi:hypothetical protein